MPEQAQQGEQSVKRRRVTRACDECRKKKVKCDGQQPCIHCTVYSYECTYKKPTKRTQNSGNSGVLTLGNVTTGPSSSTVVAAAASNPNKLLSNIKTERAILPGASTIPASNNPSKPRKYKTKSTRLQSKIDRYKQIFDEVFPQLPDIDNLDIPVFLQIFHNFKRDSQSFLDDTVKEYTLIVNDSSSPIQPVLSSNSKNSTPDEFLPNMKSDSNSASSNREQDSVDTYSNIPVGREIKIILPPKAIALQFVKSTWEHCCVLLRFYHRPSFIRQLDELYETDPNNYTSKQMQFLPLCYAAIAVGALFSKSIVSNDSSREKFLQDEGYKYFIAARKLIDITNARDLNSIQAILMLFIFLQCSARLSTCYTYIGVAMRSALRAGFHRKLSPNSGFSPIEIEMRKRLFYTIYKLDVYINAMLGLPRSISPDDFDQTLPLDLSDENITEVAYLPENQHSVLSSTGISNEHTKLFLILNEIISELYPIKKTSNIISHETVTSLELKLRNWLDSLPKELIPNAENIDPEYERANRLLHLSFLHVQIILYRPFIYYLSRNMNAENVDPLCYRRARNSIAVARTVIKLAKEMVSNNLLTGSYWYACYTIFYSVAGLLFYIHEAQLPDKDSAREYYDILKDAETGRSVLIQLKDSSMAASRTYNLLNQIFEKLNSKTIQLTALHSSPSNESASLVTNNSSALKPHLGDSLQPPVFFSSQDTKNSFSLAKSEESTNDYAMANYLNNTPISENPLNEAQQQDQVSQGTTNMSNERDPNNFLSTDIRLDNNGQSNILDATDDVFIRNDGDIPTNSAFDFSSSKSNASNNSNPDTINNNYNNVSGKNNNNNNITNNRFPQLQIPLSQDNLNIEDKEEMSPNIEIKNEQNMTDSNDILGVFDQLDAQLFGKYLPLNYPSE
ncbi:Activator of stress genes 1 [Saccharomyces cerevisiae]|nr:Activator of stress genes 1 [Saccharomyces cerevisiae]